MKSINSKIQLKPFREYLKKIFNQTIMEYPLFCKNTNSQIHFQFWIEIFPTFEPLLENNNQEWILLPA